MEGPRWAGGCRRHPEPRFWACRGGSTQRCRTPCYPCDAPAAGDCLQFLGKLVGMARTLLQSHEREDFVEAALTTMVPQEADMEGGFGAVGPDGAGSRGGAPA